MANAFQLNAFQNPVNFDHLGFQVDNVSEKNPRSLQVDQSIQFTVDQWEVQVISSDPWRARSQANAADIATGLLNDSDLPDLVTHIKNGKIDEWELEWTPGSLVGRVRGRDSAAYAVDTALAITYVTGGVAPPPVDPSTLPRGLRPIPGVTERIYKTGLWRASTVAADLATRVGLTASYQAPDYILKEDIEVSGPIIGALQQLIEPFSHFEPYKVDIWAEGDVLVFRQRQGLLETPSQAGPNPGTLNTISVEQARISSFLIRAKYLDAIRILRLSGAVSGPCSEIALIDAFTEQYDVQNAQGNLRVTVTGTKRRVDNAMLTQQTETYDLDKFEFKSRETTIFTQDPLEFDSNCRIINSPLERGSQTTIETVDPDDGAIRVTGRTTVAKAYDGQNFLATQTTTTEAQTTDDLGNKVLRPSSREVKRFFDNGTKTYTEETTKFKTDSEGTMAFDTRSTDPGGGHRPGGPGRSPRETQSAFPPAYINEVIDNVPGAKDFSMENKSLTQPTLNIIRDQVKASSGAWEYNVEIKTLNTPWIRKGQMLQITGLKYEDDATTVDLPAMLVSEVQIDHSETTDDSHSLATIKCIFWSKTWQGIEQ